MSNDTGTKAKVLVPLYIYPLSEKTWQPLYDSISAHPNVEFLVIVNPNSGAGGNPLPSHDYVREVPKLNAFPNVSTIGYVLIDYCRRPLKDVLAEIDIYAGWSRDNNAAGLGLGGILLDESPNHHSEEREQFLDAVYDHIKASSGLLGDRLVVHNPGTPPDAALAKRGPDVIVTSEEPYDLFAGDEVQKRLREYHFDRERSGYMISGVPKPQIQFVADQLRSRGVYLFATDLVDNFYESFGSTWGDFVAALDTTK